MRGIPIEGMLLEGSFTGDSFADTFIQAVCSGVLLTGQLHWCGYLHILCHVGRPCEGVLIMLVWVTVVRP